MSRPVRGEEVAHLREVAQRLAADPGVALAKPELAAAARTVCALLAARFPGGTVELRVPPFAAVQLGLGDRGRHTRGTPPNVVQTDPATLIQLASGALEWSAARSAHLIQASGIYAELDALWPLPELS